MTIFHHKLLEIFLLNLARSSLVLFVIFAAVVVPEAVADLGDVSLNWNERVSLVVWLILGVLDHFLPLALLLATLFTAGPLARRQELTALSAAGHSMFQIIWPLIAVGGLAALFSLTLRVSGFLFISDPLLLSESLTAASKTAHHVDNAYPLVNIFAVLTGIILGTTPHRITVYGDFGKALLVLFLYFLVTRTCVVLGSYQWLSPLVAGWLGPTLFAGLIALLWHRANR